MAHRNQELLERKRKKGEKEKNEAQMTDAAKEVVSCLQRGEWWGNERQA
jgi:hypothetical protein